MSQYDESQCYPVGPNMVSYKGELFSVHFPRHLYDSVIECLNCKYFGKWNGCIIMQCTNCCSENETDEMPICYGAIDVGVEAFPNHKNSPSSTYLKDVDWSTLGDVYLENSIELCSHLPQLNIVAIHDRMYLFNRLSVPYRFTEITNTEIEQMQESDTESVDTFDGLLPGCCDPAYDQFNSETFPDLPEADLSEDDLPPLIPYENAPYINKLIDNLTNGHMHPLSEVMTWTEVMEAFKDWKKFRGIETEDAEESCMDWAKYIKKEWEKECEKDMERTGEHYPEVVIEYGQETVQDTDLQNQTGIFDWTPINRRDRIEFLRTQKYKQCDEFEY